MSDLIPIILQSLKAKWLVVFAIVVSETSLPSLFVFTFSPSTSILFIHFHYLSFSHSNSRIGIATLKLRSRHLSVSAMRRKNINKCCSCRRLKISVCNTPIACCDVELTSSVTVRDLRASTVCLRAASVSTKCPMASLNRWARPQKPHWCLWFRVYAPKPLTSCFRSYRTACSRDSPASATT